MSVQRVENSATTAESLAWRVTMAAVEIKVHLHPLCLIRGILGSTLPIDSIFLHP